MEQPGQHLRRHLRQQLAAAGVAGDDLLLVAFSGGPDSTALLLGLAALAPAHGWQLLAAHVDHGLDAGSARRAARAAELAAGLGVEHRVLRPDAAAGGDGAHETGSEPAGGPEAAARRLRYRSLERLRRDRGARWLLTAHHADDQAETVLLRLLHGSGIAGLAAMRLRQGHLLRPLLALDRALLAEVVAAAGVRPLHDPSNDDLAVPRNRLRRVLLPAGGEAIRTAALGLAVAADATRRRVEARVDAQAGVSHDELGPRLETAALRRLPAELLPWALAALHRAAGLPYPPRRAAVAELGRQLRGGGRVGCACSAGWHWRGDAAWLRLAPASEPAEPTPDFAYTFVVPGGVEIREAATTFQLTRRPVATWLEHHARGPEAWAEGTSGGEGGECMALQLPLAPGDRVTVRNRRAGDRLQPAGSPHRRRLKDLLIDRRVPRARRGRLPLLCIADQVAWVPGVAVHDAFRLRPGSSWVWVAELVPETAAGEGP